MSEKELKILIKSAFEANEKWSTALSEYENATDPFTKLIYNAQVAAAYTNYKYHRNLAFLGLNTLN